MKILKHTDHLSAEQLMELVIKRSSLMTNLDSSLDVDITVLQSVAGDGGCKWLKDTMAAA